ncbi:hypothetical protein ACIOHS_39730 [Streptomyces sp. NPDC088253]|uniref:hypothetical protein n=1 Tax=Streptomyces sp. NPDC088253 TaxID=3365846 RepID=UPI0037F3005A
MTPLALPGVCAPRDDTDLLVEHRYIVAGPSFAPEAAGCEAAGCWKAMTRRKSW